MATLLADDAYEGFINAIANVMTGWILLFLYAAMM